MKTSLVIMAAGIGSRFGGGIKQLEPVGIHDELIIDYSIHDAIQAGFNKIIFVIRKDIEQDFHDRIGIRVEKICSKLGVEVAYGYQNLSEVPDGFAVPEGRTKPWGTGQAVLSAREQIHEAFAVINADDYYGKEAFQKMHAYLTEPHKAFCMAGFILKNTLSEHGGVTRGICKVSSGMLTDVVETKNIMKSPNGATVDGIPIDADAYVSMNMWGFPAADGEIPEYMDMLSKGFIDFFQNDVPADPLKAEYLLPIHIGSLLREKKIQVSVLETRDKWFGVTYKEDKDLVVKSFRKLIEDGVYPENLYADLL